MEPTVDGSKLFLTSPLKNAGVSGVVFSRSPIKAELFSPFKDSSLSPFKLIYQSPSKGSFDDWDKDFIASFEENLFGMNDSPDSLDEWLRSPKGKSLLDIRNSPLRAGAHQSVVKRLKISPENKHRKQTFHPLHDSAAEFISAPVYVREAFNENNVLKGENTCHDHMYGQSVLYDSTNTLTATDPNKKGATPVKPWFTNMENAPIRKLSMRMQGNVNPVPNVVVHRGNIVQVENIWPSKEKLKFARQRFKEILNSAVEKEIEIIKEQKKQKTTMQRKKDGREQNSSKCSSSVVVHTGGKASKSCGGKSGRHNSKGGKTKGKHVRSKSRKDKYPQIKMALAKPHQNMVPNVVHKELFPAPGFSDPGWYPSDDCDSDDDTWTGPPPVFRQSSSGINDVDSSDEDWKPTAHQYETLSGRKVKKRRLY